MSRQYLLYSPLPSVIARTRWYISIRWFVLLAVALPSILALYIGEGWSKQVQYDTLAAILAVLSNGIFYIISRNLRDPNRFRFLAIALLMTDIMIVTYLIFINGGVESRSPILYIVPVLMSAVIFGRKAIYTTAYTSIVCYSSLIIADYMNILRTVGAHNATLRSDFPYVLYSVVFFTSVLIILTVAIDFNTKLLLDKERQAKESLEDLKRAQSIAKFGSWEWDAVNDKVMWSDELYRMFDVAVGEPVNFTSYMKMIHPDDHQKVTRFLNKASKNGSSFGFDHRIITRDNVVRYVHSDGQSMVNSGGKLVKMIGTAHDITETKRLDDAKSEFVSLASHQLRTPATGVKQYLGMLLDGYTGKLTSRQHDFLQTAYDSNERQLHIINDLLQVAQVDTEKMQLHYSEINLVALLHSIIDEQKPNFTTKNQSIVFSSRYKKLYIAVDERRLRMALENIIDNAHKYTPERKNVTVRLQKQSDTVLIRVIDEGIGIAMKDLHKVFEKFSRLSPPDASHQEGSGLGLYWAKRVVEFHGGTITIQSKPNKGTTFTVSLPSKQKKGRKSPQK